VNVGIAYSGEYPVSPYGSTGDQPFQSGIEPGTSASAISFELSGRPRFAGGDAGEATLDAFSMLSGGPVAFSATPFVCTAGRVAGGCWRPGARRVVVLHTDSAIHNLPPEISYAGITPTPQSWPAVRTQLMSTGTVVMFIDAGSSGAQYDTILSDLGQPASDRISRIGDAGPACDAIVARVRALAGL